MASIHTDLMKDHISQKPVIPASCLVQESAAILGDVVLGENCSIWCNAVLRGDQNMIRIGDNVSIQDNATVHVDETFPTRIGDNVTVGHNAVIHGCTIEGDCIIGMGSIILSGAHIGKHCIIGAGSVITEGARIPDRSIVMGVPGKVRREATEEDLTHIERNWKVYLELIREYRG